MLTWLLKSRWLWQGKIFDIWTIPHTLSGTIIAYLFFIWGGLFVGFFVNIAVAIVWELFEYVTDLSKTEPRLNGLSDIMVAQVGYGLGVWLFLAHGGTSWETIIIVATVLISFGISALGWLSHTLYAK